MRTQNQRLRTFAAAALVLCAVTLARPSRSVCEELPLWEVGIGATAFTFPDYVGSDEQTYYGLPFPYFVYRGERFKVNREAITGNIFSTDRLRLLLSMGGSLPVDSDDNDAREGMPDLDLLGELGANLRYLIYATPERRHRVLLDVPVRAVFAFDVPDVDPEGFTSTPNLRYTGWRNGWTAEATLGMQFADNRYHEYFYGVDSAFATPTRREYDADGGYGGIRFSIGAARRTNRWWYGAFFRFADINGATFSDSPLVRDHQGFFGGFAFAWIFATSKHSVEVGYDVFE